jgi:hypothetical protein
MYLMQERQKFLPHFQTSLATRDVPLKFSASDSCTSEESTEIKGVNGFIIRRGGAAPKVENLGSHERKRNEEKTERSRLAPNQRGARRPLSFRNLQHTVVNKEAGREVS